MSRRYLLDTNAAELWLRNEPAMLARTAAASARGATLGTCTPVVGELWYGVENSSTRDANARRLSRDLTQLVLWPYTEEAAEEFGRLRALLRRIGRPMQIIDVQLAAVAFALGSTTVVTTDSDLSAVPGLAVEDWSSPESTP